MTAKLYVILYRIRNITLGVLTALGKLSAAHLYYVNESDELFILKERCMERSNLRSEVFSKLLYYICKVCIRIIHSCYKETSGELLLLTHLPSLDSTDFNACLCINYDDCCACSIKCFFNFSDKVEITGTVKEIDLDAVVLYRYK